MEILIIYIALLIIPLLSTIVINFGLNKYKNKKNKRKLTGCEVAHEILDSNNLDRVYVVANRANINRYNSVRKVIKLSDEVFDENTIYGIALGTIRAIEATLDNKNSIIKFRDKFIDTIMLGTIASYVLLVLGLAVGIYEVMYIALALMIISFIFNTVMFINEKKVIEKCNKVLLKEGYVDKDELDSIDKVLNIYRYNYYADMINCLSRVVEFIIPEN